MSKSQTNQFDGSDWDNITKDAGGRLYNDSSDNVKSELVLVGDVDTPGNPIGRPLNQLEPSGTYSLCFADNPEEVGTTQREAWTPPNDAAFVFYNHVRIHIQHLPPAAPPPLPPPPSPPPPSPPPPSPPPPSPPPPSPPPPSPPPPCSAAAATRLPPSTPRPRRLPRHAHAHELPHSTP